MSFPLTKLSEVTDKIGSGVTPRGGDSVYIQDGTSLIRSQNVYNSQFTNDGLVYIDDETATKMKGVTVFKDDVLLNITGDSVARCCKVDERHLPARVNQHVAIVRANNSKLNPDFLMFYLTSPYMQTKMLSWAGSGGTRKALTKGMIEGFEVPTPDIDVQLEISGILKNYNDLIENNKRRVELLEESARQLYKEWFVRFRFPGHEHVKIIDGVPEGWEKTTAADVIEILSGGTPKTTVPDYWNGEIGFYTPKDSTNTLYVSKTEKTITSSGLDKCASKLYLKDTLFITARGTVGKINLAQKPMAMNQSCYALVGKEPINQIFLYFAMQAGIQQVKSRAVGAVFDAIIKDTFKVIPFIVPPKLLIDEFTDFAEPILKQIDSLLKSTDRLVQARDILLPKLMSGEIAV